MELPEGHPEEEGGGEPVREAKPCLGDRGVFQGRLAQADKGVDDSLVLEGDPVDAEVEDGAVHVLEVAGALVAGFPVPV